MKKAIENQKKNESVRSEPSDESISFHHVELDSARHIALHVKTKEVIYFSINNTKNEEKDNNLQVFSVLFCYCYPKITERDKRVSLEIKKSEERYQKN